MAQRPLDLQKVNQIYELFEAGSMISEIVTQVGTNRETVRQYLLKRYTPGQKRRTVLKNFRQPKGKSSPNWQGGRQVTKTGYIRIWTSRYASALEHRLVMEQHLGRKLSRDEVIHHINGNNADNRIKNLQLTTFAEEIKRHKVAEQRKK
ncbi:HNH endonuclease [Candidatus Saccharibacteria bacterium]|nr:HNH endonuclease [Candidatus Saccharibacteria bacterium]